VAVKTELSEWRAQAISEGVMNAARKSGIGIIIGAKDANGNLRRVFVNEAAADILGYSVDELLAQPAIFNVAPTSLARVREATERRNQGQPIVEPLDMPCIRKDGSTANLQAAFSPTVIDGVPASVVFLIDVTERRSNEERISRSEQRLRALFDVSPEGIAVVKDGRWIYSNPAYARLLGYERVEDLLGQSFAVLMHPDDLARAGRRERLILDSGMAPSSADYRVRHRDGHYVILEVNAVSFEFEGQKMVLGLARDITKRKDREEQLLMQDRLAAVGQLSAGVAHEINNPLSYVLLALEYVTATLPKIQDSPGKLDEVMSRLRDATHGAQRVATIVRDLSYFARPDNDSAGPVQLADALDSALSLVTHQIKHLARITLDVRDHATVLANASRLEQVFVNLLVNAGQAIAEVQGRDHEIKIVSFRRGSYAVVEISDTGVGIPENSHRKIFDPFFTTKPVGVGTGLGLPICHGIITGIGGSIEVESQPGRGTTFRVLLPAGDGTPIKAASSTPTTRAASRSYRILIVDDEPALGASLARALSDHDVEVEIDSQKGLNRILGAEPPFDAVLLDLMMPGLTGIDVFETVCRRDAARAASIIFITAGPVSPRAQSFFASVKNRKLFKPFPLEQLESALRDVVEGRQ
jgi:PAS domain S-box-containing protein